MRYLYFPRREDRGQELLPKKSATDLNRVRYGEFAIQQGAADDTGKHRGGVQASAALASIHPIGLSRLSPADSPGHGNVEKAGALTHSRGPDFRTLIQPAARRRHGYRYAARRLVKIEN